MISGVAVGWDYLEKIAKIKTFLQNLFRKNYKPIRIYQSF